MITQETIEKLLQLNSTAIDPKSMGDGLVVTFYPPGRASDNVLKFSEQLRNGLQDLGIKIVPFEDAIFSPSFSYYFKTLRRIALFNIKILLCKIGLIKDEQIKNLNLPFYIKLGKKIKKGIVVVATGEGQTGDLPMDRTLSFKENPIVTIVDRPAEISEKSDYKQHMDAALKLFTWHMTNLIISVAKNNWTIYSFNGSFPTYNKKEEFLPAVLNNLIPKIAAPVTPPRVSDFEIRMGSFVPSDEYYAPYIKDLVDGGEYLAKTGLYPSRRNVVDLPFRNNFYKWVGNIHLDKRSGMSYGFVARQLPIKLGQVLSNIEFSKLKNSIEITSDLFEVNSVYYLKIELIKEVIFVEVPEVFVLTSKSGADKSHLNIKTDIIKMGLSKGKMILETPSGVDLRQDYKPSFDTKVILAHAVGNAIIASILNYFKPNWEFSKRLERNGASLAHWHGYILQKDAPKGYFVHGQENYSVSCSSPQSGIYALNGKLKIMQKCLEKNTEFVGDIHIEPHHGVNVNYTTLVELAEFLLSQKNKFMLG